MLPLNVSFSTATDRKIAGSIPALGIKVVVFFGKHLLPTDTLWYGRQAHVTVSQQQKP